MGWIISDVFTNEQLWESIYSDNIRLSNFNKDNGLAFSHKIRNSKNKTKDFDLLVCPFRINVDKTYRDVL